jgi:LuxR family glucitol operon transcriptional activator
MTISEQRLTLFALLSQFENDCREIAAKYVLSQNSLVSSIGPVAFEHARQRAFTSESQIADDKSLLAFLDIGDAIKLLLSNRTLLPKETARALNKNIEALEQIASIRNRVMHQRPLLFDDLPTTRSLISSISQIARTDFKATAGLYEDITRDRNKLATFENIFAYERAPEVLHNLPQPDFEDTGFMGRREKLAELKKAIYGPYPVVTVLGIGGVGKTALALNLAYEIINESNAFDAVIWTSAKTTRLTGIDVQEISGAISDSVGIASAAFSPFGDVDPQNPFSSVLDLLGKFRVLLFIDNLETVLDDRVRKFVRDVPAGSKIIFTSRVGLGAYDFVVNLDALSAKEAEIYFRRVSSVWNQQSLTRLPDETIHSYCKRLNFNPLGIKWFVQAVSAGAPPQKLLAEPTNFLKFCLDNIVDNLGHGARTVLAALSLTGRTQSPASLHFLTEIDPPDVEDALRELVASNLITVIASKFGEEDRYVISMVAQTYLSKLNPPTPSFQAEIRTRQNQLVALEESARDDAADKFIYDTRYIFIRREFAATDAISAKYLRQALVATKEFDFGSAQEYIAMAKALAPSYFEIFKIEAYVLTLMGHFMGARHAYDEAVALNPRYPPLRLLYAGFLIHSLDDLTAAEQQLGLAILLDPEQPQLITELARALLYQKRFSDAALQLDSIDPTTIEGGKLLRKYYDLSVQVPLREAEDAAEHSDLTTLCIAIEKVIVAAERIPIYVRDRQIVGHLAEASLLCRAVVGREGPSPQTLRLEQWQDALRALQVESEAPPASTDLGSVLSGHISGIPKGKPFGFIIVVGGESYFFHRSHLVRPEEFSKLRVGMPVRFALGTNERGMCAVNVETLDSAEHL